MQANIETVFQAELTAIDRRDLLRMADLSGTEAVNFFRGSGILPRRINAMTDAASKPLLTRKPDWLKRRLPTAKPSTRCGSSSRPASLHTSARRPSARTSGSVIPTVRRRFSSWASAAPAIAASCSVSPGQPEPLDPDEPGRVAEAVERMGLKYVVVHVRHPR